MAGVGLGERHLCPDVDPARPGDVYILANAGPIGSGETFGQPLIMVVHLPEARR